MADGRSKLRRWWNARVLFVSRHHQGHLRGNIYIYAHCIKRRITIERMQSGFSPAKATEGPSDARPWTTRTSFSDRSALAGW